MIIRPRPVKDFTTLPNSIFRDHQDMSAKAKFMLLQLLSKPQSWNLNTKWLADQNAEGIHAVKSSVLELESAGFIHKFTIREGGRIKKVESVICYPAMTRDEAEGVFLASEKQTLQQVFSQQETSPIINKEGIKDRGRNDDLREREAEPVPDPVVEPSSPSTPHFSETVISDTEPGRIEDASTVEETAAQETIVVNLDPNRSDRALVLGVTSDQDGGREDSPKAVVVDFAPHGTKSTTVSPAQGMTADPVVDDLFFQVPEKQRIPSTKTIIARALSIHTQEDIKNAIGYTAENVKGGPVQFRAYLDRTIQNGWAEGWSLADSWKPRFNTGDKKFDSTLEACWRFANDDNDGLSSGNSEFGLLPEVCI